MITTLTLWLALAPVLGAAAESESIQVKGADLDLLGTVRAIAGRVAELRGQAFDRSPVAVRAPEELRIAAAEIRASNIVLPEVSLARGRAWRDIGLGLEDSPSRLFRRLAADVPDIGLDPVAHRLLVDPGRLTDADFFRSGTPTDGREDPATLLLLTGVRVDEPLTAHLLMHLRQRERFGGEFLTGTTDQVLARAAWAEGEANLLAIRYLFGGMGLEDEILRSGIDPAGVLGGALVPDGIGELSGVEADLIRFVYLDGFYQAARVYLGGNWAALDGRLTGSATTRDVLHPERPASQVEGFAENEPPAAGMRLVDSDSIGEQGIVVLISRTTGKDDLALQAGDGWAGDRLDRWEGDGDDALTDWRLRFENQAGVEDFVYAFRRSLQARFGRGSIRILEDGPILARSPELAVRVDPGTGSVRVRVASGAPAEGLMPGPGPAAP